MKLRVAWIGKTKEAAVAALTAEYLKRTARYTPTEGTEYSTEEALMRSLEKTSRTVPVFVALDPRGKQVSSEELAAFLREHQDRGTQELVFAIGPADGWSAAALARAQVKLSLGKMTLPHELARVVLAEQLYRGFTILAGHPYHGGH
ncbi:MAG TPA: 23S rRNA (pseudouridine(1915)-N(3))-methyltransferase RlmH [candidate division Zixibacteria bacterium]|nr:23S rRNA (pseudouridine(1915)-N(3))-methyltransferase RlmH [candidate division Zixibacteria bacterium]